MKLNLDPLTKTKTNSNYQQNTQSSNKTTYFNLTLNKSKNQLNNNRFLSTNQFKEKLENNHFSVKAQNLNKTLYNKTTNSNLNKVQLKPLKTPKFIEKIEFDNHFNQNCLTTTSYEEIEQLHSIYHTIEEKKPNTNTNKEIKKKLIKMFNIQTELSDNEKIKIKRMFQSSFNNQSSMMNSTHLVNKSYNSSDLYKPDIKYFNEFYKNPYKSLQKLKRNKQIHHIINVLATDQQESKYMNVINKIETNKIKLSKMPEVKVMNNFVSTLNTTNEEDEEYIKAVKRERMYNTQIKHQTSRETLLEKVNIQGIFLRSTKIRPPSRIQTASVIHEGIFYIIGGLNRDRLFDIWAYDIINNTWKNIVPVGDTPLPRMGHSATLYRNEIFIFGGNIENNPMLPPKEDIIIYDICIFLFNNRFE